MTRIEELEREIEDTIVLEGMASWELHQATNLHVAQSKARTYAEFAVKRMKLVREWSKLNIVQERDS